MRMLEAKSKGLQIQFNKLWLAIPALSDFITSTLQYVALNFISGSVYQMMRGGSIVTTLLFSIIFLKVKVMKSQISRAGLALFGVMVVGLSNMVFKDDSSDGPSAVILIGKFRVFRSLDICLSFYHYSPTDSYSYLSKNFFLNTIYSHFKLSDMKECLV